MLRGMENVESGVCYLEVNAVLTGGAVGEESMNWATGN